MKFLLFLSFASLVIGPLGSLPLSLFGIEGINIYFSDAVVGLISITWITRIRQVFEIIKKDRIAFYFFIFITVALISLILSPVSLNFAEKLTSFLYLVRLVAYFSVYLTIKYLIKINRIKPQSIIRSLIGIGLILSIIGWLQYFLYPDLRNLYYLGWDPHYKRIFATYFDPNFLGIILVLSLISTLFTDRSYRSHSEFISRSILLKMLKQVQHDKINVWFMRILIFITLLFTYSRSSFLSLIASVFALSIYLKRLWLAGAIFLLLITSSLLLPRPGGEGIRLERVVSIQDRIESWRVGFQIFAKYPILGVGFNTLRYVKRELGISEKEDWLTSHSGAGIENSFLFVAATTGTLGLITIIFLMYQIYRSSGLLGKISLIAIITHSLFLNSFFLPFVMLWIWSIIGINLKCQNSNLNLKSLKLK